MAQAINRCLMIDSLLRRIVAAHAM